MIKAGKKLGLVLEGGGLRGIFTSGILDTFLEEGIQFDGIIGVSSGALFGVNFVSKQPTRALDYNIRYKDDSRYMSWRSLFRTGDYVNNEFSYDIIPHQLAPLDFETFKDNPADFHVVCSDIKTGRPVYKLIEDADGEGLQWLRATSSMPLFARPVELDGHLLLDGGMTDSIPLEHFQRLGYQKNVVILTQPEGYVKKPAHLNLALRMRYPRYPEIARMMDSRHKMYNMQLNYVKDQERKGNVFVIRPDFTLDIGRLEQNEKKMEILYQAGVRKARQCMIELLQFMDNKHQSYDTKFQ